MIFNRNKFFELIKNNSEKAQKLKFKQFILDSLSVSDYDYPKILNEYNSLDCSTNFFDRNFSLSYRDKCSSFN